MQTVLQQSHALPAVKQGKQLSIWERFMNWSEAQEERRFGWTAVIIMGHGCVFTIFTVLAILFTGNHFIFWPFAIAAMALPLVTNLAAMSMRVIIPVFFLSLLIDLAIIGFCLVNGFSFETVYPG